MVRARAAGGGGASTYRWMEISLLPGPFGTEMNRPLLDDPDEFKRFVANIPLGRWGDLDEIKGLALFLASDASSFVTGAGITIDGGWTAR